MKVPSFKLYLFDVDGTLVDSAADICGAIQGVLASTEQNNVPNEVLRRYIGRHLFDLWADLFPGCSPERMEAMLAEYRSGYLARKHASTRVYPHVKEVLSQLPGLKSTATTKATETTRAVLQMFGLLPYFDHVQGTDGFPAKPAPDVILKSLDLFKTAKEDCLLVGDSAADMEAAGRRREMLRSDLRIWPA